MKRITFWFFSLVALPVLCSRPVCAQVSSSSSLSGSVIDPSGRVIPGADVTVKNEGTGAEYKVITSENGTFYVPSLNAGSYKVVVQASGFKTAEVPGVTILAATPASIKPIKMEIGSRGETVTVEAGAEVLQTQSAEVATTIIGRQITELPFTSRDALDLVILMPDTFTGTNPRGSTVAGLPQGTINITMDGINVQGNDDKESDGFYTWIRPRVDAVEQVTVSTSSGNAESSGEGTVQIKFVTRSGNNEFHGSLYEYHRDPSLSSNYWFNNRDIRPPLGSDARTIATWKAPRDRNLLNQFGGRAGGPIILPQKLFGPLGFDGHDKAFFFVNLEDFELPQQLSRNRSILNPRSQQGIVRYVVTNPDGTKTFREVDLMTLAGSKGQVSTFDPTIQKLLQDISTAAHSKGFIDPTDDPYTTTNPNIQRYTFVNKGGSRRIFPTIRLDFNLTRKHRIENTYNYQIFRTVEADFYSGTDIMFPGFPNHGLQDSNRFSDSLTLRSTFTPRLVNEARYGLNSGTILYNANVASADFSGTIANQGGFSIGLPGGLTGATSTSSANRRNNPVTQIGDTLSWMHGTHNFSFGGEFSQVGRWYWNRTWVPSISLGVDTSNDPAAPIFSTANRPVNFPGATSTDASNASNLYALFTGRVTQISGNAYLSPDGKYYYVGPGLDQGRMRQMGFFAQDSWRIRPNLTLTGGLRWELQLAYVGLINSYSTMTLEDVWGVSGVGNLFKPGIITGQTTAYEAYKAGEPIFKNNWKNLGPSLGIAWTPKADGLLRKLLGFQKTVVRGGASISYSRYGVDVFSGILTSTPGRSVSATRNQSRGNLVSNVGTDVWPLLFRQKERLGPGSFQSVPSYPNTGTISDGGGVFDPNFRMPVVVSWTFGLQREITKNTVIELRYNGNRGTQFARDTNVNSDEYNIMENGTYQEFWKAQANMYANYAAGKGLTWAYTGIPGTSPLPISLAYLQGLSGADVNNPAKYTSSQFSLNQSYLEKVDPNPLSWTSMFDANATYRANALVAGLPANFFRTNPDKRGSIYYRGNGGKTYYDATTLELRRRMAQGLSVQANYTYSRSFELVSPSFRAPWYRSPSDLSATHALKINWIYELPIGRGKIFLAALGPRLDRIFGGWEFHGIARIQSGNPIIISGVRLVGMTQQELQSAVELRFDDINAIAYWLPQDIINNSIAAFNTDPNQPSGYSSTWGAPKGRYIAPANSADCVEIYTGKCSTGGFSINGIPFSRFDLSLIKRMNFNEDVSFELRGEFLNAFNNANFRANGSYSGALTMGRVTTAYRDASTTNDPGGRIVQLVARINF